MFAIRTKPAVFHHLESATFCIPFDRSVRSVKFRPAICLLLAFIGALFKAQQNVIKRTDKTKVNTFNLISSSTNLMAMSINQRRFISKLNAQGKCGQIAMRHYANVAERVKNAPISPPFAHKMNDYADVGTVIQQTPKPKWMKAGIRIERNSTDQNFQILAKEIVDKYGWDNSEYDYALWNKAFGPNFSMFFAIDESRQPMGCISMALYPEVAHWSMYYVKEQARGLQLGRALTRRSLQLAGERPVFGYGVAAMWFKYAEEYGLNHFLDWRLLSLSVKCADVRPQRLDNDTSVELKDWQEVSFDKLLSFDRLQTVDIDRRAYLLEALRQPQSVAKVAVSKSTGEVVGMCQARMLFNRSIGISLFYADNSSIASALLRAVLLQYVGPDSSTKFDTLIYKTPSNNADSVRLLRQLVNNGKIEQQVFVPQFSRRALPFPGQRIFSISDEHVGLI